MKNSKSKMLTTVVLLTIILAAFGIQRLSATNYTDVNNYCLVEGVFHSDSYTLYPYAQESLDVGFSKYGEMIGYNEATGIGLGLQYPGYAAAGNTYDQDQLVETSVDPFANEQLDVDVWMNGWFIDIKYQKATGEFREIWAFALFSDGTLHGGSWIEMTSSTDPYVSYRPLWQEFPPYANPDSDAYPSPKPSFGGRKTNGKCVTDPITIVYNGPRKYVAVMKTRISDGTTALVDVFFTLIFNKADKNVIVLKDVKRLYDKKMLNIQFGNRGEWDLSPPSYVHFYTDEPVTSWDVNGDGSINPSDEGHDFFFEYQNENKHPKKWWDEIPSSEYPDYVEGEEFDTTAYPFNEWFETQYTCYGREWHTDKTIKEHSYAVVQVIDADAQYVGAMAVWPHPEFWTVENSYGPDNIPLMLAPISRMLEWHKWTVTNDPAGGDYPKGRLADRENIWIKEDDMASEPDIPFVIYEHDFKLQLGVIDIYRIVSAYVLTDWHDADDHQANDLDGDGVVENKIDREIQYQLDEIFDPWDINDAMHKNTKRWVQFFDRDYEGHLWNGVDYYIIELDSERTIETGDTIPSLPVYRGGAWDEYCTVSERVMVNTGTGYELIWPHDDGLTHDPPPRSAIYDDYHMLDPIPYENTGVNTPYYTIDLDTGIISFWRWDDDAEEYLRWCLPTGSIVKVEWSSLHEATVAGQWDYYDELYPLDGDTYRFPLHHDIIYPYNYQTEVFMIEWPPYRIFNSTNPYGPWYEMRGATLRIHNATDIDQNTEIEIKYWIYEGSWYEEKFVGNGSATQDFILSEGLPDYVEKVWIHSEKAITTGDYVFNEDDGLLYMAEPLAAGQWLFVNYTSGSGAYYYEDWFYGEGDHAWDRNVFELRATPDVGTLQVFNTEMVEEIINETCYGPYPYGTVANGVWVNKTSQYTYKPDDTKGPPSGVKCPVPDENYAGLPEYKTKLWIRHGWYDEVNEIEYEECEWIKLTDEKLRGNYIIRETSTCDELVLDQVPQVLPVDVFTADLGLESANMHMLGPELKIVYKVPSGRWEWATVGKAAASVDSLGLAMVTAAFKNKLIEIGIGGLDTQDTASGSRVPWLVAGTADSLGRYHLYDDWCYSRTGDANAKDTSWPISSSNIITVGGTGINILAKYSNDWIQAITPATVTGYYAVTCWDRDTYTGGSVNDRYGYAVISTFKDKNGTAILVIRGWTGQDTYYACNWFDVNKYWLQHLNLHVTDLVLKIEYKYSTGAIRCVPIVTIVEKLGTISEKPQHDP